MLRKPQQKQLKNQSVYGQYKFPTIMSRRSRAKADGTFLREFASEGLDFSAKIFAQQAIFSIRFLNTEPCSFK